MSTMPKPTYSPSEYLAMERASEERHEYFRGEIFAMSGASRSHNLIGVNLVGSLLARTKERGCELYSNDMRVKISTSGLYTYPDIAVTCSHPQFEDEQLDTLLNPSLIIEILSKSTESYDRGTKFRHYRSIPSLQEYVLVAQDQPRVEHFARTDDDHWLLTDVAGLDSAVRLPLLDASIKLGDIYDRIEFAEADT